MGIPEIVILLCSIILIAVLIALAVLVNLLTEIRKRNKK